jgi:GABA(A) receptor-associated protein
MDLSFDFKKKFTLEQRLAESSRIQSKYPDRIPIVVEANNGDSNNIVLDKSKYLVPSDLTFGQLVHVIRKRVKLSPEEAIFMFTSDGALVASSELVSSVYKRHKCEDGFVYFKVSKENTFG